VHLLATFLVAFGTTMSAFWILSAELVDADADGPRDPQWRVLRRSWLEVVFNPSFPYRLVHVLLASG
jgi:cytochrome d ubiquinol oxidase subunit I